MHLDDAQARLAVRSRDRRFDGVFVTAVTSTRIYCRPSCPARTPQDANMRFYASAAAAQEAGFRACKRCRPDAAPGSPAWDARGDTAARAMRLIVDGVVDREGVPALATSLGYSVRQLERVLQEEFGAGPASLARARRAWTARTLLESTAMPMAEVAFAAGFASVRAFNDVVLATYDLTPSRIREAAGRGATPGATGRIALRLPFREPLEVSNLLGHLIATAVPGVEEYAGGAFRSAVALPHGTAVVEIRRPADGAFPVVLRLADVRDLGAAVARVRRLLDLDADPTAVDEALSADPALAPVIARAPGRRVPRSLDPDQLAIRAVLGQQVSTAAARTHAGRLAAALGEPLHDPDGGLTHLFPTAATIAGAGDELDAALRLPAVRRRTVRTLATALADGTVQLDAGTDLRDARRALAALPGIGPWTIDTIAMRALGDPDAFLAGDLGVRRAAEALGVPGEPKPLEAASRAWSPWRAYAVQYLWSTMTHAVNTMPDDPATANAAPEETR